MRPLSFARFVTAIVTLILAAAACDGGDGGAPRGATAAFTSGVAAGDVTASSAVLWTRAEGGDVVMAEVARDPSFDDARTVAGATSAARHFTVKIALDGLEPATRYHYRFRAGDAASPAGTFVTAPASGSSQPLRFVFSGDADGRRNADGSPVSGEFELLDTAAAEDPAFFIFLGDTVYADRGPAAVTLDGYRAKHRQNREYPPLQRLLGRTSTYAMWDDHEVLNDFAGTTVDPALFEAGRRAFREYMPIAGDDDDPTLYRAFRWGTDAELILLDERSYRDESASGPCDGDPLAGLLLPGAPEDLRGIRAVVGLPAELPPACMDALAGPARTMLGADQKRFLFERLSSSDATWKLIVNSVPIQQLLALPYDRWEGYDAERREVLEFIRDDGVNNVVFLTTDLHATVFGPVRVDVFAGGDPVAYEAVAGPIATTPLRDDIEAAVGAAAADAFVGLLEGIAQVDCASLDTFSYGLVEIDPGAGTLTVSSKDTAGRVLCSRTLAAQ